MSDIKINLKNHLLFMESSVPFSSFSNNNLYEWAKPICEALEDDGSISYLISNRGRFRASPLASTIISLSRENLIPNDVLDKMQEALLFLRDNPKANDSSKGCSSKNSDDFDGWSLSEGVSVWSTSMAIIALIDNKGVGLLKASKFKNSVVWLANQRNVEYKGWGYQNTENCTVNVIMTALSIRALAKSFTNEAQNYFNFSAEENSLIKTSIIKGMEYLVDTCNQKKKYVYWDFNGKPNCAATTWALLALKEASYIATDTIQDFINKNTKKGLLFVLSKMPSKSKRWEEEQIVQETGAKYDSHKNYYSFSATLIPELISLGLSPFHTKVVKQIQWIVNNKTSWKTKYDRSNICSFTYAMLISTISCWIRCVGCVNAIHLLNSNNNVGNKVVEKLSGYSQKLNCPMFLIEKKKIIIYISLGLSVAIFILMRDHIVDLVQVFIKYIPFVNENLDSIGVNIVSSIFYGVSCFIISQLLKLLKRIFRIGEWLSHD